MLENSTMPGALQGITVLDLTRVLAGPFSTMMLADMGANVIKIEEPKKGDDTRHFGPFRNGESIYYITNNRNKKGISLNLKDPKAKEMFKEMVKKADVVTENYRPGTMEKLGLGYDVLKELNPRIIYGCISGFGHYGRYKDRPGYDIIAQAMSGLMSTTGWPDSPPTRTGTATGDVLGGLYMTIGILAALQGRHITGLGQKVDVALVDSAIAAMGNVNMLYLADGSIPKRIGNRYESTYPYDSFECKDGSCVIGAANDKFWQILCSLMEKPAIAELPEYLRIRDRIQNHVAVKREIEEWSRTKTASEVVDACLGAGIPAAPVYDVAQVVADPHISQDREMFVDQEHPIAGKVTVTGSPFKLSGTPATVRTPSPALGQDNLAVYQELLGLDEQQLAELKAAGVI
ncbi:CaiB/BaiF CoA transferase family protein [Sporomusa termitida]|uniref:Acetyl-CoA:oxalate CoA-transferase n=1 Tax=Sporomusa termitida TaxID=2377 RepID=A0A517DNK3_9FIRM|nr:CoA transferase [Sporomusa termitida]QDR78954.1 Acetyl-CoA:oxalate CoA-transferase [Sporomusa termitida]